MRENRRRGLTMRADADVHTMSQMARASERAIWRSAL